LSRLLNKRCGMVGIEVAMVLIAFVIVAAAFSFMVVNMGLFSTQRGRETIQQGVSEASSPLTFDGSIHVNVVVDTGGVNVTGIVVPLKTLGVRYVPMSSNESEVTCRVENKTVFANMYVGINSTILPTDSTTDTMFDAILVDDTAELFIGNTDYDASLDYDEKGFLVFKLDPANAAAEREHVFIEIRPEKGAPLTIEFIIPPQLTVGWHTIGS